MAITQYVLARDGHVWILTNSGPDRGQDATEIANTFRFASRGSERCGGCSVGRRAGRTRG